MGLIATREAKAACHNRVMTCNASVGRLPEPIRG